MSAADRKIYGETFPGALNATVPRRVIVQDNSFVGKKVAVTSIPYSRITSVSVLSNKSMMGQFFSTSSIAVHSSGQTYEVEFRGNEKAHHVHQVILWHITK